MKILRFLFFRHNLLDMSPSFDVFLSFRCVYSGSVLFVSLIHTCHVLLHNFTSTLTTITLNDSRLKWFGAYFWKPTPKDLPSSLIELNKIKALCLFHHKPPNFFYFRFCGTRVKSLAVWPSVSRADH